MAVLGQEGMKSSPARPLWCFLVFIGLLAATSQGVCVTKDKIRVQLQWVLQSQFIGYMAANEFGFYNDECIEIAILPGGPGINAAEWVQKDVCEFGIAWMAPFVTAAAPTRDLVMLGQVYQHSGTRAITLKSSGIDTLGKLKGKTVASWDGLDAEFISALNNAGLVLGKNVSRISQGYSPVSVFETGNAVAAMVMTYNELALMLQAVNPDTERLYELEDLNIFDFNALGTAIPQDGIFMKREWLDDPIKQNVTQRFLRASIRGWIQCRINPSSCIQFLFNNDEHQKWQLNEVNKLVWVDQRVFGTIDLLGLNSILARSVSSGVLQANQTQNITELYDTSLMSAAVSSLAVDFPEFAGYLDGSAVFTGQDFSWCLRKDDCSGGQSIPYICTGNERDVVDVEVPVAIRAALAVIAGLGIIAAIVAFFIMLVRRQSAVVVSASPLFVYIILLGISLIFSSVIASSATVSESGCTVFIWLFCAGLVIAFASLFAKTHRIYRIFSNSSLSSKSFRDIDVALIITVALLIEVLLLLATFIQPPVSVSFIDASDPYSSYQICQYFGPMIYTLIAYKALIILVGVGLSVAVRNVQNDFYNESSHIAICIYNMAFLTAIVVPIIAFVQSPVARFVVQHVAILLLGFVTFCVLFLPKLGLLIKHDDETLLKLFKSGSMTSSKVTTNLGTNKYLDAPSVQE